MPGETGTDQESQKKPGEAMRSQEKPGEARKCQERPGEKPGEARRGQERPGEARRDQEKRGQEKTGRAGRGQEKPGKARRSRERPGKARRSQERPGEARRSQEKPGEARTGHLNVAAEPQCENRPKNLPNCAADQRAHVVEPPCTTRPPMKQPWKLPLTARTPACGSRLQKGWLPVSPCMLCDWVRGRQTWGTQNGPPICSRITCFPFWRAQFGDPFWFPFSAPAGVQNSSPKC